MSGLLPRVCRGRAAATAAAALILALPAARVGISPVAAQAPRSFELEQIAEDLYLITGEGGNVAALVTEDGILLVDNMFYRSYEAIAGQLSRVSEQPIAYVINTHQHDDHAGGNARLASIAEIIAHENVWLNLSDIQQPYYEDSPGTPIGLPQITFRDQLSLRIGGRLVRALHLGRGHTNGDAVIHFPELGVIHTGDLFLGRRQSGPAAADRPRGVNIYVDYAQGGSFREWTATLDAILKLDFELIIPGHGPLSTRAELERFRADLELMRDRIAGLIAAGATREQILTVFELDYGWRSTGCPPSPPTPGCLQFQQMDALVAELAP